MQAIQDVNAEQLAKLFHHYREALVEDYDSAGKISSSWDRTPQSERRLMAAARLALLELSTAPEPASSQRKYYAQPGEAEMELLNKNAQKDSSTISKSVRAPLWILYGLFIPLLRGKPSNQATHCRPEVTNARCNLGSRHHRVFRHFGRVRSFLRPGEVGAICGYSISDHDHHQCRNNGLPLLRPPATGEILI